MTDAALTPDEERQVREAIDSAPDGLKDDFCKCWPVTKRFLQWVQPRLPKKVQDAIDLVIRVADAVCAEK